MIELSHRGNKLPQQQRRRAADRRRWSAWTHPSELPAVLMLSALLRRPFLGFSVALFPFCAPVDCFCVNDAARRAAVGHGLWDGRPPTHDGLGPHPHALETAFNAFHSLPVSPRYLGCLGTLRAKSVVYAKAHNAAPWVERCLPCARRPTRTTGPISREGGDPRAQYTRCCSLCRDARRVVGEPRTSGR